MTGAVASASGTAAVSDCVDALVACEDDLAQDDDSIFADDAEDQDGRLENDLGRAWHRR